MLATLRFIFVFAAGMAFCTSANAQPPTAPPPHLALDELVKEYRRLGLPIPPPNAEFVRFEYYNVGLRIPAAKKGEPERYLMRCGWGYVSHPETVVRTDPTPQVLREIVPQDNEYLWLAIQSKILGWDEFADHLHGLCRARRAPIRVTFPITSNPFGGGWLTIEAPQSLLTVLRSQAWYFWDAQITTFGTDRVEVLQRLRQIADVDEEFRTEDHQRLLHHLELTVAPRRSKPGSVESLIDDLVDYGFYPAEVPDLPHLAYQKLSELGFDAIPALIEHAQDLRFTRERTGYFNNFRSYNVRVGHLVSELLDAYAAEELHVWSARGGMADPGEALKWYAKARQIGEEKWLVENALPSWEPTVESEPDPNEVILRTLRAKYPKRLPEVYQLLVRKRPWLESRVISKEIAVSALPREQKITLLEEGAAHAKVEHRIAALLALAKVDTSSFRKHLIKTLEWLPKDIEGVDYDGCPEGDLAWLVYISDDRQCWDAFIASTRRVCTALRLAFLQGRSYDFDDETPAEVNARRDRERFRYLLAFFDDESIRGSTPPDYKWYPSDYGGFPLNHCEVRDFAAWRLAWDLGFEIDHIPNFDRPITAFAIRAAVAKAAERELARPGK